MNQEQLIERWKVIHNNFYDYSLVDYKSITIHVKIICPIHGVFEKRPDGHNQGFGCVKCKADFTARKIKDDFIKKSKLIHGDRYDYSLVDYKDCKTKVKLICPIHGIFKRK